VVIVVVVWVVVGIVVVAWVVVGIVVVGIVVGDVVVPAVNDAPVDDESSPEHPRPNPPTMKREQRASCRRTVIHPGSATSRLMSIR